ncbi:MAG: dihydrodipicolinate synthase family protein [Bryobacterales bacterium]|nr:dihydrodipicolinate synthase family protein [Bryobacterales bacterium]
MWREKLQQGVVIPAHPLALTAERKLDERRQRALSRYYLAAGAGGLAVGVHTTQFAIREPRIGLYEPVLRIAAEEMRGKNAIKVAGVVGLTSQAVKEAVLARDLGYDIALLSMAALKEATVPMMIDHVRTVASILPVLGFYLQPAVGGRLLPYEFWRQFAEIEGVVGIKISPFNRYQTLDVLRAVAESSRRDEIALYTGNDDTIVTDLLTEFKFGDKSVRIKGGLLGHWAAWTKRAVELLERCHRADAVTAQMLTLAAQVTDTNAALFDVANNFHGCIAGIHEVLRRQGLLEGRWCLDPNEDLSPGQMQEIDRVYRLYPYLTDDGFVRENLDNWLKQ